MSLKFIPPKEEAKQFPRYASYGDGQLKTHRTLSGARNSLNNRTAPYRSWEADAKWKQGFILENVDGEWYTLYHVKEGSTRNELPWMHKRWSHKQYHWKYYTEPTNSDSYVLEYYSRPMTTDEYVDWRLAVERERLGI
jgi:hypothetical protein